MKVKITPGVSASVPLATLRAGSAAKQFWRFGSSPHSLQTLMPAMTLP
jgi:hypothetical protein